MRTLALCSLIATLFGLSATSCTARQGTPDGGSGGNGDTGSGSTHDANRPDIGPLDFPHNTEAVAAAMVKLEARLA